MKALPHSVKGLVYEKYPTFGSYNNWKTLTRSSAVSLPDGSVYVTDTTDYARIFDNRLTYDKGAFVLHMLRWVLGDSTFFQGVRNYLNLPHTSYGFARTRDLKEQLEMTSGNNLDEFFNDWYYGEGYPQYNLEWMQNADSVTFWISQEPSDFSVPFFEMPLPIQVNYPGGNQVFVANHTSQDQTFTFYVGNHDITGVIFDPDRRILSKNNIIHEITTAIHDVTSNSSVILWPNPCSDELHISSEKAIDHINLTNSSGLTSSIPFSGQSLSLGKYPSGVYWIICYGIQKEVLSAQRLVIFQH
jgi:hypothetical protein